MNTSETERNEEQSEGPVVTFFNDPRTLGAMVAILLVLTLTTKNPAIFVWDVVILAFLTWRFIGQFLAELRKS